MTSAAIAVVTDRIEIRAGSVISPLHDALSLAEDWAVIDNLSHGRVALSFGSGWNPDDFILEPAAYPACREVMWEQIAMIRHLWRGGKIERPNGVGATVQVSLVPRPVQKELPLWITTGGTEETFVRAGSVGANLLTHLITQDLDALAERIGSYRAARARAGFDPEAGQVSAMVHTFVGESTEAARAVTTEPLRAYLRSAMQLDMKAAGAQRNSGGEELDDDVLEELLEVKLERYFDGLSLIGDAATCSVVARDLEAIGVTEAACLIDFGIDHQAALHGLTRLYEVKEGLSNHG